MSRRRCLWILPALAACAGPAAAPTAPPAGPSPRPAFEIVGWDLERLDPACVVSRIREARAHDVNVISLSHEIVMNAEEILHDWHRYKHLNAFCDEAHANGMQAWLWNHQVNNPPEELVATDPADGRRYLDLDDPRFGEWLADRYRRVVARVPGLDAIVLSLTESEWQVHRDPQEPHWYGLCRNRVRSRRTPAERMAFVIHTIRDALAEKGKRLVVRDFFRSPAEMESFREAMASVPPDVWVYTKCVPNDWQYRYPPHPLLGKFPGRKQVMELDLYNETAGNARSAMLAPAYHQRQIRMARELGLAGVVPRIDDGFRTSRGTAREFNLFCFNRLMRDPDADLAPMWGEFFTAYCGGDAEAARVAVRCFQRTEEMVCGMLYTLGAWTGAGVAYTDTHLEHHGAALWSSDPRYAETDRLLKEGGAEAVRRTVEEKRRAEELAAASLRELAAARDRFTPATYAEFRGYFEAALWTARARARWARAYFRLRAWRRERSDAARAEVEAAVRAAREFLVESADAARDDGPAERPAADLDSALDEVDAELKVVR